MSRLNSVDDLLLPAVATTLSALPLTDEDLAAARLARRYAATIDDAQRIAADLAELDGDADVADRIRALSANVEAQTVLERLGPRLLAVLDALCATPQARRALAARGGTASAAGKLHALRSARRA